MGGAPAAAAPLRVGSDEVPSREKIDRTIKWYCSQRAFGICAKAKLVRKRFYSVLLVLGNRYATLVVVKKSTKIVITWVNLLATLGTADTASYCP